jgi:S1-C subfamily serine protease
MQSIIRKILLLTFFILLSLFYTLISHSQVINLKYNIEQVTVRLLLMQGDEDAYCTGVVIKNTPESSQVLTAKHCVGNKRTVYIGDLKSNNYKKSRIDDLAVVYFDKSIPNKLSVKKAWDNNKVGDKVYHLGYPMNKEVYVNGKITSIFLDVHADFKPLHGCSGGGVFNESGELVGIEVAILNSNGEAIFEPIKSVRSFLNNLE